MVRALPPASRRTFARVRVREAVRDSFWVIPTLFLVGAVVLTWLLGRLDETARGPVWWVGTAQSAADVLRTIAGSMLAFLAVVFSITLVALQLASQQFSPRVTRTFVRSTATKVTFGVFIATFVCSLLSLARIEERSPTPTEIPIATVTVSILLVGASLAVFIVFVNSITRLIRVAHLVSAVADETRVAIRETHPALGEYVEAEPPSFPGSATGIAVAKTARRTRRRSRGVLLGVDSGRLVHLAATHDCVIRVMVRLGQHMAPGAVLAEIHGSGAVSPDEVRQSVQFGRERTLYQDPAYGIRELVDIASQALSPSVNAPTTAVQVIDRLTDLLSRIGLRPDPTGLYVDDHGVIRLVVPTTGWDRIVDLAFTELRTFGVGSPQVTRRMVASIDRLMAALPPERRFVLDHQRALLIGAVEARYPDPDQRDHALSSDPLGLG